MADIVALLRADNEQHWSRYVDDCRNRMLAPDYSGVEKLLSSYGGMGSFNDVVIGYSESDKGWKANAKKLNENLNLLRTQAYELAQDIQRNHAIGSTNKPLKNDARKNARTS
ncbi:MAG TPA: hypothetical protein VJS42_16585 [Steroidobacteraceae bacterium]|nr:hypothetical protein [Steroidobacteraceae bacterium]